MYPPTLGVSSTHSAPLAPAPPVPGRLSHSIWLRQLVSEPPCRSRQSYAILGASLATVAALSLAVTLLHSHVPPPAHLVPPLKTLTSNGAIAQPPSLPTKDPSYLENVIAYDANYGIEQAAAAATFNGKGAGNVQYTRIGLLHLAALDQLAVGIGSLLVSGVMAWLRPDYSAKRIHDDEPSSSASGTGDDMLAPSTLRRLAKLALSTMVDSGLSDAFTALSMLLMSPFYAFYSTAVALALSNLVFQNVSSTSQFAQVALAPVLAVRLLCTITPLVIPPGLSLSMPLIATLGIACVAWISSLSFAAGAVDVAKISVYTAMSLAGVGLAGRTSRDLLATSMSACDRPSSTIMMGGQEMFVKAVQSLAAFALLLVLSLPSAASLSPANNGFTGNFPALQVLGFVVFATVAHFLTQYAIHGATFLRHHPLDHSATVSLDPTVHTSLLASPSLIPPAAVELLRDAGTFLAAGIVFGITDVSPFVLKAVYCGTCAVVVHALVKARSGLEHALIHSATTSKVAGKHSHTERTAGSSKSVLVLAALTLSLALIIAMPSSNSPASPPTPTGVTPSVQTRSPSASRRQWSSWDRSMPLHYDLTLRIDPSLPGPSHIGQKAAKVFAVDSDSVTAPAADRTNIVATLPPLSSWPRRKWDRQSIARHANFSLRHHVRFGNTGSSTALHRYIAMYQMFADPNAHSDVHLRIYWTHADDPRGLYGVQSHLMHAYMNATGSLHYPVILGGDWKLMAFHMLMHMYDTSPEDVQWFALGAEGTVWFPRQVQALVTSLDVDPMQTYVYMGEVSESKDRQRTHGNMAGAGGGMLISRALAAQLHKHHAWCVQHLAKGDPGFFGADLIKACIDAVAVKVGIPAGVPLTRVPMFNPLELMGQGWPSGRAYLSARVSRAPPVTLSDLENLPPLFSSGMLTRMLAVHDWWHLVEQMPRTLMFRRFFVHVRGRDVGREATIVVTFGLHVRVYERIVTNVDHPVDFDGPITKDPEMWGADWLTENAQVSATNKWTWPNEETSFTDFWIHEYDERDGGLMVYLEEGNRAKFGIRAKCEGAGEGNVLTLCAIPEVVDGWVQ